MKSVRSPAAVVLSTSGDGRVNDSDDNGGFADNIAAEARAPLPLATSEDKGSMFERDFKGTVDSEEIGGTAVLSNDDGGCCTCEIKDTEAVTRLPLDMKQDSDTCDGDGAAAGTEAPKGRADPRLLRASGSLTTL